MSDRVNQIEAHVYYARWKAQMKMAEISGYADEISALADANDDNYYTIIVDMTETQGFAMDVSGLARIARSDPRIIAYVFIKGDNTAKFIGRILHQLSSKDFIFVETYDEALDHVREVLAQHVA